MRLSTLNSLFALAVLCTALGAQDNPDAAPNAPPAPSAEPTKVEGALPETPPATEPSPAAAPEASVDPLPLPDADTVARINAAIDRLAIKAQRDAARQEIIAFGRTATAVMRLRATDPSFTIRWEMVNIQGTIKDERAIPYITERIVMDENPHVRWRAMWAMNCYADTSSFRAKFIEHQSSPVDFHSWNANVGLSMLNDPACLDRIHRGLKDADEWRAWEAMNALGRVWNAESSALVCEVLDSTAIARIRNESILSLGKINDAAAIARLLVALHDGSKDVRWRAAMCLGKCNGGPEVDAALAARLQVESDSDVRTHLQKAQVARKRR